MTESMQLSDPEPAPESPAPPATTPIVTDVPDQLPPLEAPTITPEP